MTLRKNSSGFTLVELMIASTVFSVVLVLVSTGIVQIGNRYYKTTLSSRTQTATRNIVDELSRGMQFSGILPSGIPATPPGNMSALRGFCVNNIQYNFRYQSTTTASNRTFVATPQGGAVCNNNNPPASGGRDLLAPGMRLQRFELSFNPTTRITEIKIRVLTTPETRTDMVTPSVSDVNATCGGGSSHLCAVSELSTVIQKRVQ